MSRLVRTEWRERVVVLTLDNPPLNVLSSSFLRELVTALAVVADKAAAVIIHGAGRAFAAGADLKELLLVIAGEAPAPEFLSLMEQIEDCPCPLVMALNGAVLGGGLELAMGGHYRIAHVDTEIGQPEVNLGLTPGAGATQRLPRLVGLSRAVEMCLSGKPISAHKAHDWGLLDQVVTEDVLEHALAFAATVPACRRTRLMPAPELPGAFFASAHQQARLDRAGETAPVLILQALEASLLPWPEGCRRERELFLQSLASRQADALTRLFFAERDLRRKGLLTQQSLPWQRICNAFEKESGTVSSKVLQEFGFRQAPAEGGSGDRISRLISCLVQEEIRLLAEGYLDSEAEADALAIHACGFPAWRGGPLYLSYLDDDER